MLIKKNIRNVFWYCSVVLFLLCLFRTTAVEASSELHRPAINSAFGYAGGDVVSEIIHAGDVHDATARDEGRFQRRVKFNTKAVSKKLFFTPEQKGDSVFVTTANDPEDLQPASARPGYYLFLFRYTLF